MTKPEHMFDIVKETTQVDVGDGRTFTKTHYYLVYKHTGEKHFSGSRKWGYSSLRDAKGARTRLFNDYMKALENMLGKA